MPAKQYRTTEGLPIEFMRAVVSACVRTPDGCLVHPNTSGAVRYKRGPPLTVKRIAAHFYGLLRPGSIFSSCGNRNCIERSHFLIRDPDLYQQKVAKKPKDFVARFWSHVDQRQRHKCWPWKLQPAANGYGKIVVSQGKAKTAHRVMYELQRGPIPAGMVVRHTCDNRICVNPSHLIIGTHLDNSLDTTRRNRQRWQKVQQGLLPPPMRAIKCLYSCVECGKPVLRYKCQVERKPLYEAFCGEQHRRKWLRTGAARRKNTKIRSGGANHLDRNRVCMTAQSTTVQRTR